MATTIVTCGALAAAAVLGPGHAAVVVVGLAGFAAVLIVAVYSAVVAGRAAKAARAPGDGQPR